MRESEQRHVTLRISAQGTAIQVKLLLHFCFGQSLHRLQYSTISLLASYCFGFFILFALTQLLALIWKYDSIHETILALRESTVLISHALLLCIWQRKVL